jgi:hypothetical protein
MSVLFKIILNLLILACVYKMDSSGYGLYFAFVALARYELGPMLSDKEPQ